MTEPDFEVAKKYYINQIKQNSGRYHFGTSGTIFGLGYGPKCHRNEHGHSIDRYSSSKFSNIISYMYYIIVSILI